MKIVIGIPSYNEENSIGYVVKQIDLGLRKFHSKSQYLIINVDSDSKDKTKKVFLKTPTFYSKKCLNIRKKPRGKGRNLIELFKYCDKSDVDFIAVFDSDIKTLRPHWISSLLNPLITERFDYTTPVYSRGCYDGNVTNNFAYPLTYALFGINLQQPIGGEFGLNKRLYKYLLRQPINEAILGFGIDIFMTYHAIGAGFKIREVYLGEKRHKPGFSSLMDKFLQFSQSAIVVSRIYREKLNKINSPKGYKKNQIFKTRKRPDRQLFSIQLRRLGQNFENNLSEYYEYLGKNLTDRIAQIIIINKKPALSCVLWIRALSKFLNVCYEEKFDVKLIPKVCQLIAPIFYWRVISFWEEMGYLNPIEIDEKIRAQAKLLRKKLITE